MLLLGEFPCDKWADGGFRTSAQGTNQENWHQGQRNQGRIYGNYNREGHYVRDGKYNRDNNLNRVTTVIEMIGMGPMSLLKIVRLLLEMLEIVEDMLHKMMRRFNASDEHIKELRCDLEGIGQKVYTHAISIKQIELQMP